MEKKNTGLIVLVVVLSLLVVGLGGFIIYDKVLNENNDKVDKNNNNSTTTDTSTEKYCNYCGAKLPEGKTKCPLCGASNNNK